MQSEIISIATATKIKTLENENKQQKAEISNYNKKLNMALGIINQAYHLLKKNPTSVQKVLQILGRLSHDCQR